MKQILGAAAAALALGTCGAGAASFDEYPAEPFTAKPQYSDFQGAPEIYSVFHTRLNDAAHSAANFGGRWVVEELGCGSGCVMAFVIDHKTGAIVDAPISGENNLNARYYYRADSNLLKTTWIEGDFMTGVCMIGEWVLDDRGFHLISATRHVPLEDCQQ
ncbi:hypothetical protein SAMN05877809_103456 [Rhodobacter sp. JA431]|uniref:hypothetical protein n=1 Tax=Rhodobacter sp. JA431 TaxID=570013 RepID=UPI000BD5BF52|nr:hypothetical protein [Rhodobacter sp. JA431]SOC05564.1 hypothetical protein SAMN05877809_103456 [Rhodobacter sp. JA431]